jgi:hypothetical protein
MDVLHREEPRDARTARECVLGYLKETFVLSVLQWLSFLFFREDCSGGAHGCIKTNKQTGAQTYP